MNGIHKVRGSTPLTSTIWFIRTAGVTGLSPTLLSLTFPPENIISTLMLKVFIRLLTLVLIVAVLAGCPSITKPLYPQDPSFRAAEASFLRGDYQTAINNYIFFITAQPNSEYTAEAYYRIGLSYLALDNKIDALSYLQDALTRVCRPQLKTQILNSLGILHFRQHNYPQAIKYYKSALKGDKTVLTLAMVYYNSAISLMRNGQWREGKEYMHLARNNAGNNTQLREAAAERLSLPTDTFTVQLGRFINKENAILYQKEVLEQKGIKTSVNIMLIEGQEFYHVWAGMLPTYGEAVRKAEDIRERGLEAIIIP